MSAIRNDGYRDELAKLTPSLRRFARALVGDHSADTADDLVQAALVAALGADHERRGVRLQIWTLGTIASLHRRFLQQTAREEVGARNGSVAGGGVGWDPARRGPKKAGSPLCSLPLECREVLLLVTLERLSYVQTAESLGLTLNAVVGHLARARDVLSRAQTEAPLGQVGLPAGRRVPYLRVVE